MRAAVGAAYHDTGPEVTVRYEAGPSAHLDGWISTLDVAVEIESRVDKQVRGALMDLVCHRAPRKLVVLIQGHMSDVWETAKQCVTILTRFVLPANIQVVVLQGTPANQLVDDDAERIRNALAIWTTPSAPDATRKTTGTLQRGS
jgi:hypothetical protein